MDRITHPQLPESHNTALKSGLNPGCLVAEVTRVDDSEGNYRIRARADLIDRTADLPCGEDGWIPVITGATLNATSGGAVLPIEVGMQAVLAPVYPANGKNWICLGFTFNRVDRPHADLQPANRTHGLVTRGGVVQVNDDKDQSALTSYPHGVVQYTSGDGDVMTETAAGARQQLTHDGHARLENQEGFTAIDPDGTVTAKSGGDSQLVLDQSGTAQVASATGSLLSLEEPIAKILGPQSPISQAIAKVSEGLDQSFRHLQEHLRRAQNLLQGFSKVLPPLEFEGVISDVDNWLKQTQAGLSKLQEGLEATQSLTQFNPVELGGLLVEELTLTAQQAELISAIETVVGQGGSGAALMGAIQATVPGASLPADLATVLDGLAYNPELQTEQLLETLLPGGFDLIREAYSNRLSSAIPAVREEIAAIFQSALVTPDPEAAPAAAATIVLPPITPALVNSLAGLMPEHLRHYIDADVVSQVIAFSMPFETTLKPGALLQIQDPAPMLLGLVQQRAAANAGDLSQSAIATIKPGLADLAQLTQTEGDASPETQEQLRSQLGGLVAQLKPQLEAAVSEIQNVVSLIPSGRPGALLEIDSTIAQMADVLRSHKVFAGIDSAGIKTPKGSIGFAGGGGFFNALKSIAMTAGESGGGLHIDPEETQINSADNGSSARIGRDGIDLSAPGLTVESGNLSIQPDRLEVNMGGRQVKITSQEMDVQLKTDQITSRWRATAEEVALSFAVAGGHEAIITARPNAIALAIINGTTTTQEFSVTPSGVFVNGAEVATVVAETV